MTIHIPKPVLAAVATAAALLAAYVVWEEGPPLYRYLFKFEAM
jgi:hypothetical protein